MELVAKNFIVISVIASIALVFVFHWFFIARTMPVTECFSVDCIYSTPQAVRPDLKNDLLAGLIFLAVLFAASLTLSLNDNYEFKKVLGRRFSVFKGGASVFDYKLNSWLTTLEKKDPNRIIFGAI